MNKKTRFLAHSALLAALYVSLTYLQHILLPGTTSLPIQFRFSEALCVLALFTPAAIPGLTLGCLIFNIGYTHTLPLDFLLGTLATFLAVGGMYLTRRWTVKEYPLFSMLLPAVVNGLLVGWEISLYVGGAFGLNGLYVALGEAAVLLSAGSPLFCAIKARNLDVWLRS